MKLMAAPLLVLTLASALSFANSASDNGSTGKAITFSGFECADEVNAALPLLGRGNDFPHFVFRDIESSLQRQSRLAKLVEAHCTSDAKQTFYTKTVMVDEQEQEVLSQLEVVIPMKVVVVDGAQTTALDIEQIYLTTNLETIDSRKTVQTFNVLSQQIQE
ncbi:hypothetical protein D210916BOD24_27320 [Alteromonas sp. D210916BOD_24]|uniref:hypothetical protein n=1 Tax=Alteromonas sp. D210916BOD_24 TaxID=3157618 RepID=UPI00399C9441